MMNKYEIAYIDFDIFEKRLTYIPPGRRDLEEATGKLYEFEWLDYLASIISTPVYATRANEAIFKILDKLPKDIYIHFGLESEIRNFVRNYPLSQNKNEKVKAYEFHNMYDDSKGFHLFIPDKGNTYLTFHKPKHVRETFENLAKQY